MQAAFWSWDELRDGESAHEGFSLASISVDVLGGSINMRWAVISHLGISRVSAVITILVVCSSAS